jgi:hypothetical protein
MNSLDQKEICIYPLPVGQQAQAQYSFTRGQGPLLAGQVIEVSEYGIAIQRYHMTDGKPGEVGIQIRRTKELGISFLTWGALKDYELKTFDALLINYVD